jgi:hypothetical protein
MTSMGKPKSTKVIEVSPAWTTEGQPIKKSSIKENKPVHTLLALLTIFRLLTRFRFVRKSGKSFAFQKS